MASPARASSLCTLALFALVTAPACRRAAAPDAHTTPPVRAADAAAAVFGPPNPWGDGALPSSTAEGPAAESTRAAMTALRASIGFWRVERDARAYCPALSDLAQTPGAAFDPATMRADAWGSPFEIECQGATVRLRSLGPDRTRDTADDIVTN